MNAKKRLRYASVSNKIQANTEYCWLIRVHLDLNIEVSCITVHYERQHSIKSKLNYNIAIFENVSTTSKLILTSILSASPLSTIA